MARAREAAADYRLQTSRLTGTVLTKCMTALISWQCPFFSIINSLLLDRSRTSGEIDENHDVSARSSSLKMESHACVLLHRLWCASPGEISLARVAWRRNAARGDRLESRGLPEEAKEALQQPCSVGRAQHGRIEGSVKDVQPPDFEACSIIKRARQRVPRAPPRRVQDALKGLDRSRRFRFSMSAWSGSITSEA